jgi:hypothetical protein
MAQPLRFDKWIRGLLPGEKARQFSISGPTTMYQYNLKTLLAVMLAACILTWLFFVLPGEIGFMVLLCGMLIVPSAVLAGILYFRGYPQAFAIGCVPPLLFLGAFMWLEGPVFRMRGDDLEDKLAILICLLVVVAAGAASAGVRWLAVWSQQPAGHTKTFPGLSLERAPPAASPAPGSAGASPSRLLTPDS